VRKFISVTLILVFTLTSASVPATAAVKIGDTCKSVGQTTTVNGSVLTCAKSGSKLVWSKGVKADSYDTAFASEYLSEAKKNAAKILEDAKSTANQISSAPYCSTGNSSARAYIGSDGNLRALVFENPGICDITVRASASFRCDSPLPPSKNTVRSTGVFSLRAKEKLVFSNWSYYFPQVNLECRLLTGSSGLAINLSRDGQEPSVVTLSSSYSGSFNQVEASKKADQIIRSATARAEKIIADAKNPVMITKAWKAAAAKAATAKAATDKAAADKAAAAKAAADALAVICVVGGSCKVGNTGPGGGEVFYDAGMEQPWGRFLEFAPNGWYGSASDPKAKWCDNDSWPVYGPEGETIGQGKPNTKLMLQHCTSGAAVVAASYRGGSKDDWYLPAIDELEELAKYVTRADEDDLVINGGYGRLKIIREGFNSALWSSTNYRGQWGYATAALGHGQLSSIWSKYYEEHVRPIRAFSIADAATLRKAAINKNCSPNPKCSVGSIGPGGGEVFYDAGSQQSWGRYLEVAPIGWSGTTNDPEESWCNITDVYFTPLITNEAVRATLGVEIGKGRANTNLMAANCRSGALSLSRAYKGGMKGDWYLPSREELNELCKYVNSQPTGKKDEECRGSGKIRTGFFPKTYWSSSEYDVINVPWQSFNSGGSGYAQKKGAEHVRPIRAF
jgi:hypothetical protein